MLCTIESEYTRHMNITFHNETANYQFYGLFIPDKVQVLRQSAFPLVLLFKEKDFN